MHNPPEDYINKLSFILKPSTVSGVGTFAIRDIPKGTLLFPIWEEKTDYYSISKENISADIFSIISKYFSSSRDFINVLLIQGLSYWHPWKLYINHSSSNNISSSGYAVRDILKNEEVFLNYSNFSNKSIRLDSVDLKSSII